MVPVAAQRLFFRVNAHHRCHSLSVFFPRVGPEGVMTSGDWIAAAVAVAAAAAAATAAAAAPYAVAETKDVLARAAQTVLHIPLA